MIVVIQGLCEKGVNCQYVLMLEITFCVLVVPSVSYIAENVELICSRSF